MPSIVFGTEPNPIRRDEGEFFCPECAELRAYQRVEVRRTLVLFALPLLRYGPIVEYVECEACRGTYRPEVLAYDAGGATGRIIPEYQRAVRRILALMVAVDGRIRDPEIATVRQIYEAVCGTRLGRGEILDEVEAVGREPITVARYLARVVGYLNDYGKEQVLRAIALVSRCDGEVHEREAGMLRQLARVMHVPAATVESILDAARGAGAAAAAGDPDGARAGGREGGASTGDGGSGRPKG